jgi:phosphoenolpyruvate carboxylase
MMPPSEGDVRAAYAARAREAGPVRAPSGEGSPPSADGRSNRLLPRDRELLSGLLGQVLEEQEGSEFRERVERLRDSAAAFRRGDERAGAKLFELVRELPAGSLEPYVRACSMQLQLDGVSERLGRVGLRQPDHRDPERPEREIGGILEQIDDPRVAGEQRRRLEASARQVLALWWQADGGEER